MSSELTPARSGSPVVRLLEADPDLADGLPGPEREQATRLLAVRTRRVPLGAWDPVDESQNVLGLLVLEGFALRRGTFSGRTTVDLVGAGDVLRPWEPDDPGVPLEAGWQVLTPLCLAELDHRVAPVLGRYPPLLSALMSRMVRRSRALAVQHVISALPSVEQRLLTLFLQLGGRWGRVRPGGVWIGLRLSHEILGGLIGARRPSVTTALGQLERSGAIRRERDGIWLLEVGDLLAADVEDDAGGLAV